MAAERTRTVERVRSCCVAGCPEENVKHSRLFTISGEGWGEIETTSWFCCKHLDMQQADVTPLVDLKVTGVERG